MSDNPLLSSDIDSTICYPSIKYTPLSHTNIFILNIFLHVSILFAFLNVLFIYLIVPISTDLFKHEIGSNIENIINNAIPVPIDLRSQSNNSAEKNSMNRLLLESQLMNDLKSPISDSIESSKYNKIYQILNNKDI